MQGTKRRIIDHKNLTDHEKKNLMILEIIRRKGPIARADIARLIDLNNVTVTSYVDQYLKKKVVHEAGVTTSTGGRKPTLVDLDPDISFAIGLGVNSVHVDAVLCNLKGEILYQTVSPREGGQNEKLMDELCAMITKVEKEAKIDLKQVHGIGIGLPGIVNQNNGTLRWPYGLITKDLVVSTSMTNEIYDRFNVPVILDNDANTAVFAEQWISPTGLNVDSAVYLYSGSGCGLLINGHIYRGYTGCAGEFFFDLNKDDPSGWYESSVASGDWGIDLGISKRIRESLKDYPDSTLQGHVKEGQNLKLSDVDECAQRGDELAKTVLTDAGMALGFRASFIVNLLNPELIIVGGGVEAAGIVFMDAIRKQIKNCAVPEAAEKVRVVPSELGENAVPLGAAALVIQNYFVSH